MREARIRRDLIAGELAAGRNPGDSLRIVREMTAKTLADWWPTMARKPPSASTSARANYGYHWKRIEPAFGRLAPEDLEHGAIQAWVNEQTENLTPAVVRE